MIAVFSGAQSTVSADRRNVNFCDMTVRSVRGRVVVISAIDNLIKGASGAAVQNFNLMHGFDETMALL